MSQAFNGKAGLILVEAEISGPTGKAGATLVLDTGATSTSLNVSLLRSVGYDPDGATDLVGMATGSAIVMVPRPHAQSVQRPAVIMRSGFACWPIICPRKPPWTGCSAWTSSGGGRS